jgi:hypothetical protein
MRGRTRCRYRSAQIARDRRGCRTLLLHHFDRQSEIYRHGHVDTGTLQAIVDALTYHYVYSPSMGGQPMPRSMVGLLSAVAVAMSALLSLTHGSLFWMAVAGSSAAAGLVAYATASSSRPLFKKSRSHLPRTIVIVTMTMGNFAGLFQRFAARVSALASGLALAVRPAGLAEVSGAQGWVLKIVSAKRV